MTRTLEAVAVPRIVHGAGQMRALLAKSYIVGFGGAHENAVVLLCWIPKKLHSPNRDLALPRHQLRGEHRSFREHRPDKNPEIAHKHSQAGQDQKLGQLSAGHVALVGGVNGEFFLPERVSTGSSQPTHLAPPTYSPGHRA